MAENSSIKSESMKGDNSPITAHDDQVLGASRVVPSFAEKVNASVQNQARLYESDSKHNYLIDRYDDKIDGVSSKRTDNDDDSIVDFGKSKSKGVDADGGLVDVRPIADRVKYEFNTPAMKIFLEKLNRLEIMEKTIRDGIQQLQSYVSYMNIRDFHLAQAQTNGHLISIGVDTSHPPLSIKKMALIIDTREVSYAWRLLKIHMHTLAAFKVMKVLKCGKTQLEGAVKNGSMLLFKWKVIPLEKMFRQRFAPDGRILLDVDLKKRYGEYRTIVDEIGNAALKALSESDEDYTSLMAELSGFSEIPDLQDTLEKVSNEKGLTTQDISVHGKAGDAAYSVILSESAESIDDYRTILEDIARSFQSMKEQFEDFESFSGSDKSSDKGKEDCSI